LVKTSANWDVVGTWRTRTAHGTHSYLLTNEVKIDLDMLRSLMLNWVGGHVDRTDVVAVDKYGAAKRSVKLVKKLTEPGSLSNTIGHGAILSFITGTGDGVLTLGRPRDQVITKEHSIARGGLASIRTTSPVSIRVDHQIIQGRRLKVKTPRCRVPRMYRRMRLRAAR